MLRRVAGRIGGWALTAVAVLASLPGAGLLIIAVWAEGGADRLRAWGARE